MSARRQKRTRTEQADDRAAQVDDRAAQVDEQEEGRAEKTARTTADDAGKAVSDFASRVYAATQLIPAGKVATYGAIAAFIGCPSAARAVGNALRHNPFAPVVPCHRVVPSAARTSGVVGGFSGQSRPDSALVAKKIGLLAAEGVAFQPSGVRLDVSQGVFHDFDQSPTQRTGRAPT